MTDFFIIIHNHRKIQKSKRRKLLRKYKKDLMSQRLNLKLRNSELKNMKEKEVKEKE